MVSRGFQRMLALILGLAVPLTVDKFMVATPSRAADSSPASTAPESVRSIQLKVRRHADFVELVLEGAGAGPQLVQSTGVDAWIGEVVLSAPRALRLGPQRITIPELGLQSVGLDGSGNIYRLSVQPMPGQPLERPVVSADGGNLIIRFPLSPQLSRVSTGVDVMQLGRVPAQFVAPPLQPRAVAPPLGDMAVGTMVLRNRSFLNVSGPVVSMTIRNAPARDVLMTLAQMGGYGFVYVDDSPTGAAATTTMPPGPSLGRPISIAFQKEPYARAVNAVLLAAGWQGRLEGRMIMVGPSVLGKSFGAQVSKVFRLNQALAASAADYLASLGATITKVNVITNSVTQGTSQANQVAGGAVSQQTTSQAITTTETYGASAGPLKGLAGTTDSRLQTITLVGDPQLIVIAEKYLRQIDLRQRQVALTVRILDVTLENDTDISNSFAFRYGNNFIVNDEGRLVGIFNSQVPPGTTAESQLPPASPPRPPFTTLDAIGLGSAPARNPGLAYAPDNFFSFVRAVIQSRNTKVLASPTLVLSENKDEIAGGQEVAAQFSSGSSSSGGATGFGVASIGRPRANEAFITVGEQVITSFDVTTGTQGNTGIACEPEFGIAGLTFGARVSRIDDNGFVTFTLSPQITAKTREQIIPGCGPIDILAVRRLDTGSARVRDGQTLILTGVISDSDIRAVTKWPLLGDIPFVGQFFRGSSGTRQKRELVIMVTPRLINDEHGGGFGYGYQPGTRDARRILGG